MNAMRQLLVLVCAATVVGCGGGDRISPRHEDAGEVVRDGMLIVRDAAGCSEQQQCRPRYLLFDPTFTRRIHLVGDLRPDDAELVVTVRGRWSDPSSTETQGTEIRAIEVESYQARTSIPYQEFLMEQASRHVRTRYGCELLWDTTFSWRIDEPDTYLIVRLTDPLREQDTAYLELWYDGRTGDLVRDDRSPRDLNPCHGR